MRQLAAWRAAGLAGDLPVSVNLSPRQLDDEALVLRVADVLAEHGLEPSALVLEVTETCCWPATARRSPGCAR